MFVSLTEAKHDSLNDWELIQLQLKNVHRMHEYNKHRQEFEMDLQSKD